MTRLNFDVPDDLHREVKVLAARRGQKLRDLVVEILREYVERLKKKGSV